MIEKVLELIKNDEKIYKDEQIKYYESSAYVLDILDDLLWESEFDRVNNYLKEGIPYVKDLPIVIMLMYLSVTNYPGNSQLKNRSEFRHECIRVLQERGESEERIKRLLGGFEDR